MEKNDILNSDCYVRRNAAGNPNTPVDTLVELAKDNHWAVRISAAGNPVSYTHLTLPTKRIV